MVGQVYIAGTGKLATELLDKLKLNNEFAVSTWPGESEIRVTESHQSSKTSVPGTAVSMANALGLAASEIVSVRNAAQQIADLGIPPDHLERHAFHRIEIHDGPCSIAMETRVYGDSPYASGVQQIIGTIQQRALQARVYSINEFVDNGWV